MWWIDEFPGLNGMNAGLTQQWLLTADCFTPWRQRQEMLGHPVTTLQGEWSLKVIANGTIREIMCDLLLVYHCRCSCILYTVVELFDVENIVTLKSGLDVTQGQWNCIIHERDSHPARLTALAVVTQQKQVYQFCCKLVHTSSRQRMKQSTVSETIQECDQTEDESWRMWSVKWCHFKFDPSRSQPFSRSNNLKMVQHRAIITTVDWQEVVYGLWNETCHFHWPWMTPNADFKGMQLC